MAPAVPSPQWLPCIRTVPPGWSFDEVRPRYGEVTMLFNSHRDGMQAQTVLLRPSCDLTGATDMAQRASGDAPLRAGDEGQRRLRRRAALHLRRGCVSYRFDLRGSTRAEPVAAVSESLAFLSRQKLDEMVRQVSGDRLRLDPS